MKKLTFFFCLITGGLMAQPGYINTVAGNGNLAYGGDGGQATAASLQYPYGVTTDAIGNIYIADQANNRIRKVDVTTGKISTVAGNGTFSYSGDGGQATAAEIAYPAGVAVDINGNIYISDFDNSLIRKVTVSTGIITTIAGNYTLGSGYSGDGGPATAAEIDSPRGLVVDASGNVYFTEYDSRIRKIDATSANISTVAGNGVSGFYGDGGQATAAELNFAPGVALDNLNNLYIVDLNNNRVRMVTASTGIITSIAGNGNMGYYGDGGQATAAEFSRPYGIAVDNAHNVYVADEGNSAVRKINTTSGIITTAAGNGTPGFWGDGGPATAAEINNRDNVCVDGAGNLYIADYWNNRIRKSIAVTGINEISNYENIKIYPNPAQNVIYLQESGGFSKGTILNLYTITGEQVLNMNITSSLDELSIPLENLDAGVYFISLQTSDGVKTVKKIEILR